MASYIAKRVILLIPTLLGISVIVFMMVRFLPGDAVDTLAGDYGASDPELRQQLREQYKLSASIPSQYLDWIGSLARGDMGESIISGRGILDEIAHRAPPTAELALITIIISLTSAIPIGILSAVRQNSASDLIARSFSIAFLAIPGFWLATLVVTLPSRWWGWSPPLEYRSFVNDPASHYQTLLIPAFILSLPLSGAIMRLTRAQLLEVLRQDYIRTARAKGLRERTLITRHALRNALIPVITIVGLQIPTLLGGTIIMETIFGIPGLGSYLFQSIVSRDYPVVQAVNLITAIVVLVVNLLVDVSYAYVDPRIRVGD